MDNEPTRGFHGSTCHFPRCFMGIPWGFPEVRCSFCGCGEPGGRYLRPTMDRGGGQRVRRAIPTALSGIEPGGGGRGLMAATAFGALNRHSHNPIQNQHDSVNRLSMLRYRHFPVPSSSSLCPVSPRAGSPWLRATTSSCCKGVIFRAWKLSQQAKQMLVAARSVD